MPFSQNLKEQKKKSVTGEQNMKIMKKRRRNWLKKCFQRLKKIMPEKRKEQGVTGREIAPIIQAAMRLNFSLWRPNPES